MKIIRRIVLIISILLFLALFTQIFSQINLAPTYTRVFVSEKFSEIEAYNDINKLKAYSKTEILRMQRLNQENSDLASKQLIIIFTLISMQLFLHITGNKSKNL